MSGEVIRVLLVEDNAGDACLVQERLSEAPSTHFEMSTAGDLRQAERLLARHAFHVVILDLNLPDSSGLDTLRSVRPLAPGVPLIVVSGVVDEDLRRHVLAEGAEEVFSKDEANSRFFSRSVLYLIERKRTREEQLQLQKVLSTTPDGILVVGVEGVVLYVNDRALELFGRPRAEVMGELVGFSVKEGAPSEIDIWAGGTQRLCELRLVHIEWGDRPAFLAALRDITEQRAMELQLALADRMVSIGTLAAGVAHEINNPLASVLWNIELATEEVRRLAEATEVPDELLAELVDAREGAERVRHIVRDLKLFSRSDAEQRGPVDVHEVLESTIRMAWNEIRHRARLVKQFCSPPPPLVEANESKLGQVFLNLVINATQAIETGDAGNNEITISTAVDAKGRVVVTVSDTGGGLSPEAQRRIFTPFFTTKPVGVGTGLGLAISHRIVTSMGGEISFRNLDGVGAAFSVSLPPAPPAEVIDARHGDSLTRAPFRRRGKLLVIDDEATLVDSVRRAFGSEHTVVGTVRAHDGLERLWREEKFDAIVCDLMMPELSGMAFYRAVRDISPEQAARIVFVTGGAFTQSAREFLETVPNPCLEKPFAFEALRAIVTELIR